MLRYRISHKNARYADKVPIEEESSDSGFFFF